jgi:2-C-methyl-D-erythritol 4-phosphate cytidylyltransferase
MLTMDAILLGGGSGSRFSASKEDDEGLPKQFRMLGNAPVFTHAVRSFMNMDCFRQIVLAVPRAHIGLAQEQIDTYLEPSVRTILRVVAGGERRQDSSLLALEAVEELSPPPTRVLIHDACRPYLSRELLGRVRDCLLDRSYGAWVPVVPVIETLKRVHKDRVVETVDRHLIHRVQTPQVFEYTVIRSLAEKVKGSPEISFTDDASLCEYYGIPVGVFEGDVKNIKLTYPFELEALRLMLEEGKKTVPCAPELATTFTV